MTASYLPLKPLKICQLSIWKMAPGWSTPITASMQKSGNLNPIRLLLTCHSVMKPEPRLRFPRPCQEVVGKGLILKYLKVFPDFRFPRLIPKCVDNRLHWQMAPSPLVCFHAGIHLLPIFTKQEDPIFVLEQREPVLDMNKGLWRLDLLKSISIDDIQDFHNAIYRHRCRVLMCT